MYRKVNQVLTVCYTELFPSKGLPLPGPLATAWCRMKQNAHIPASHISELFPEFSLPFWKTDA